jgi:4-amino-4-deoxy-L-arabinose transferase-like glycosyltransferase
VHGAVSDTDPGRTSGGLPPALAIRSLWLLVAAAVGLLVLSRLVHVSMFFDGGIYATLARNLAQGRGDPWSLYFSGTLFLPAFAEHPPLMMWLQAVGFRVFGDSIAVEKGFSLLTLLACGGLLCGIWSRLHAQDPSMRRIFPFALVLLLASGRVAWGFANGLLENLLAVFTLAAVLSVLAARDASSQGRQGRRLLLMATAGAAVVLATLTKGPVGLFPLATPALHGLVFRQSGARQAATDTLVMVSVVALSFAALLSFDPAREAAQRYLNAQLFASLSGARGHHGGGFVNVLRKLVWLNGYALVVVALLIAAGRRLGAGTAEAGLWQARRRRAVFLLLVGLSASLPLGLSPRVSNFYFNPALFFFASGLAVLGAPQLLAALARLGTRQARLLSAGASVAVLGSIVAVGLNVGRPGADGRTIAQAAAIRGVVCAGGADCSPVLSACGEVWTDWVLHTYLQRLHRIAMANAAELDAPHMVADPGCGIPSGYRDTGVDVSPYRLLERRAGG